MRHRRDRNKLSRSASHRKALFMNLAREVFDHERIKTTEAKAKAARPEIERLITLAKRGDLLQKSESELNAIPNFGRKSIEEVIETLKARGLELRAA